MPRNYVNEYNRMVAKINKTRRRILRRRKQLEEENIVARVQGRLPRPLPDIAVPAKMRMLSPLSTFLDKDMYQKYKAELQTKFGRDLSERGFYREHYKQNYLDSLKTMIGGIEPDSVLNPHLAYYTKEQMDSVDKSTAETMKLFNSITHMSIDEFQTLYDAGYITKLSYIYSDIMSDKGTSFVEEQRLLRQDYIRSHRLMPKRMSARNIGKYIRTKQAKARAYKPRNGRSK